MSYPDLVALPKRLSAASFLPRPSARAALAVLTVVFTFAVVLAFAAALETTSPLSLLTLAMIGASVAWISGGAATALVGAWHGAPPILRPTQNWVPRGRTAILVTLCREPPEPVAAHLASLFGSLARDGLGGDTDIFVLSDTSGAEAVAAEEAAIGPLVDAGIVHYRRRTMNTGRKPGNIADWLRKAGDPYDYMLVLDSDSRMSSGRIRRMIHHIEARPRIGLLQAGISLVPAQSRFGRLQRMTGRLVGPAFVQGFAAWTRSTGNYWGHNALIRVEAFRAAADLPEFRGTAPFGGSILSHDIVEAAWIRRAGWSVVVDASPGGSAEDGPQTLEEFHRRDRRWCQGNLQHLRIVAAPGLHATSRLHMISGIFSYLAAPLWLALVVLMGIGVATVESPLPFLLVMLLLITPKLVGLVRMFRRRMTPARRRVLLRAFGAELALSTLVAPLMMVRQTGSVVAVLAGRDCGWKSPRGRERVLPVGGLEALAGIALGLAALSSGASASVWFLPILLPLVMAPVLIEFLEQGA